MSAERRLVGALILLGLSTVVGTVGYMIIEGAELFDALFMTLITLSTVGYGEVIELSTAGRVFTGGLIVVGVGAALYTAATAIEVGLEKVLGGTLARRRMTRDIAKTQQHVIVCGFGRVGHHAVASLEESGTPVVVIEADPARAASARERTQLVVEGDATHDEVLHAAGISRARSLIACVRDDADNLVIVLSAKHLAPGLLVIARATGTEAEEKLRLAGADRVVAPQVVGAERLAALAASPRIDDYVDVVLHGRLVEFRVEEFPVGKGSALDGTTLRDSRIREHAGALVLALETSQGLVINPGPDQMIRDGDTIVGLGTEDQVDRLRELLG